MPTALVTGASRGIGRVVAGALAEQGWTVYAGVRSEANGEVLRAAGLHPVVVDVTDAEQVAALPEAVGRRLDGLVNNAGTVVGGPVEALELGALRHQLEVNLVGQVAVTQALLPAIRAARGRIAFIGSVSGRVSTPQLGAYAASKFALEGLVDALRVEVRPWGIRVALIEPGSIDTDLWRGAQQTNDRTEAAMSPTHRELYGAQMKALRKMTSRIQARTAPPEKVASAVQHALTAVRPRTRYLVGADARAQLVLRTVLPARIWDAALARALGAR